MTFLEKELDKCTLLSGKKLKDQIVSLMQAALWDSRIRDEIDCWKYEVDEEEFIVPTVDAILDSHAATLDSICLRLDKVEKTLNYLSLRK